MKKVLTKIALLAAVLGLTQSASAMVYSYGDALLIFRQDGFDDVVFDLGSVGQFTNLASGTVVKVTNWDLDLVKFTYNGSVSGSQFIVVASTSFFPGNPTNAVWLSDADLVNTPTEVSGSRLASQISKISVVGSDASLNTSSNSATSYVVAPDSPSSYTYRASNGGLVDASTLGGVSLFPIETTVPGSLHFFQIQASSLTPKPAATQLGAFALDENGALTFTAGSGVLPAIVAPKIVVGHSGSAITFTFDGQSGVNYRLRSSANVTSPLANWGVVGSSVQGAGQSITLQDAPEATLFYVVEAYRL